jgi:hypothetical protein
MKIPQHITDLTRDDFEQIASVANIVQGPGILLERDSLRIIARIDEGYVKSLIRKTVYGSSSTGETTQ